MEPASYPSLLDSLFALASAEERKSDVLAAKAEYFRLTGEVFEDDRTFEMRMACFLDYYVFDHRPSASGRTVAEELLATKRSAGAPEAATLRPSQKHCMASSKSASSAPGLCVCASSSVAETTTSPSAAPSPACRRGTSSRPGSSRWMEARLLSGLLLSPA